MSVGALSHYWTNALGVDAFDRHRDDDVLLQRTRWGKLRAVSDFPLRIRLGPQQSADHHSDRRRFRCAVGMHEGYSPRLCFEPTDDARYARRPDHRPSRIEASLGRVGCSGSPSPRCLLNPKGALARDSRRVLCVLCLREIECNLRQIVAVDLTNGNLLFCLIFEGGFVRDVIHSTVSHRHIQAHGRMSRPSCRLGRA
ncbi:hypothetical protein BamIOP4010DRAFT_6774 [Burkholderia ambifaria IOP40-10]|uniref:Uncharacterized protein n=1 Tax=Burkholderia ambifaria IOP40-10 TaxID=396596 RepID=B1FRW1_9BURK|nr:hypothetical protein BamIOP4010DRAFT_6774 [Burkholderia ambifaria IOP40-10]